MKNILKLFAQYVKTFNLHDCTYFYMMDDSSGSVLEPRKFAFNNEKKDRRLFIFNNAKDLEHKLKMCIANNNPEYQYFWEKDK